MSNKWRIQNALTTVTRPCVTLVMKTELQVNFCECVVSVLNTSLLRVICTCWNCPTAVSNKKVLRGLNDMDEKGWARGTPTYSQPFASPALATDFIDRNTGGWVAKFEGVTGLESKEQSIK